MEDFFSMRAAYVDNDGTEIGDNLWGRPDPGFTSSEYREPTAPALYVPITPDAPAPKSSDVLQKELEADERAARVFLYVVCVGLVIVAVWLVWLLLSRL